MIEEKVKNQNVSDIIKTPKKSVIPRSERPLRMKLQASTQESVQLF